MTLSITTLDIECWYDEYRIFILMLSVFMLSVFMLSVFMLSVVILSVIMLSVVAPISTFLECSKIQFCSSKKVFDICTIDLYAGLGL